jgi:hypothetical protein
MNGPFSRTDKLANIAASTLEKSRNTTLAEYLAENDSVQAYTKTSPQVFNFGLHYIEKPENVEAINAFIKRLLGGTHIEPETSIREMFMHLQSIGLVVTGYRGKDGTYDIDQFGKPIDDKPISGYPETDKYYFPRGNIGGKIKISRTLTPGGRYLIDAEIYLSKN